MPFINLIQEQRLQAKRTENQSRLFFLTFVGSAGLSFCVFAFLMFQNEMLKAEQGRLISKAAKLAPLVKRIQSDENEYSELKPRLDTLQNAQLMTGRWSRILDHLTRQTPEQTWLTSIRCGQPDANKPVSVTFEGMSNQQLLIGDFIERLQSCPDLTNVNLKYTMEKLINNSRAIDFEIDADVTGTEPQATKEGGAKKEATDQ
jgi:Tfp pilus assembly protein PilN